MTIPILALFNNRADASGMSLVYHMAWMYADLGYIVVAADLDPQMNLTANLLGEDGVEELGGGGEQACTIYDAIRPLIQGTGDVRTPALRPIAPGLHAIAGDLALSSCEDALAQEWLACLDGKERALRATAALWTAMQRAALEVAADVVLIDLPPNLGAINRAALIASDHVVVPVAPDRLSLQGLETLGAALHSWRDGWSERLAITPEPVRSLPSGTMRPAGYVVMQRTLRLDRPPKALEHWTAQIPAVYASAVLYGTTSAIHPDDDPSCLGIVRRHDSLISLSQEAGKPIFHLKASDGALGSHAKAVSHARRELEALARRIAAASWLAR